MARLFRPLLTAERPLTCRAERASNVCGCVTAWTNSSFLPWRTSGTRVSCIGFTCDNIQYIQNHRYRNLAAIACEWLSLKYDRAAAFISISFAEQIGGELYAVEAFNGSLKLGFS